jgi:hypothetical protein
MALAIFRPSTHSGEDAVVMWLVARRFMLCAVPLSVAGQTREPIWA